MNKLARCPFADWTRRCVDRAASFMWVGFNWAKYGLYWAILHHYGPTLTQNGPTHKSLFNARIEEERGPKRRQSRPSPFLLCLATSSFPPPLPLSSLMVSSPPAGSLWSRRWGKLVPPSESPPPAVGWPCRKGGICRVPHQGLFGCRDSRSSTSPAWSSGSASSSWDPRFPISLFLSFVAISFQLIVR